jgi:Resolvase, N terminal domain
MRTYVTQHGWTVVTEAREVGSGAIQRPQREHLMKAARRREIDAVPVWRLDCSACQIALDLSAGMVTIRREMGH